MAIEIKRAEAVLPVCLDGTLVRRHEALVADLDAARKQSIANDRLNNPALKKIAADIVDVEDAAQRDTIFFTVRALPRGDWDEITTAHPPRKGHDLDQHYGFHTDDAFDAVLAGGGIVAVADADGKPVEFDPATEWLALSKELTKGQFEKFRTTVNEQNAGDTSVPFYLPAHNLIRPTVKN